MIAILGAMEAELAGIRGRMQIESTTAWGVTKIHVGTLGGAEICCARTGVGKAMAAAATARVASIYDLQAIVYVGIAGALDPVLEIGDMVIADSCVQHDLDATQFGFERGEVPYDGLRIIECDPELVSIASRYPHSRRIKTGRILTGDQFCSARDREHLGYLTEDLHGVAIEMEGAASALVAQLERLPFLLVRIISDRADGSAPNDFSAFLPRSANEIAEFVGWLLPQYSASP